MESISDKPPLVVIVGQTASGKSALAMRLAKKFNGEIICADSRTLYKGMDIGTAKPSLEERREVPHHLLDIALPSDPITVADFKKQAEKAIFDIASRGKLAFMVGGTGLYIDAVLFDFSFRQVADKERRIQLGKMSVDELQELLRVDNIPPPSNAENPRHLIRQIETRGQISKKNKLRDNTLVLGMQVDADDLKERISLRVERMFAEGLEVEALKLAATYGWDRQVLQTIGYQEFRPFFASEQNREEVKSSIARNTYQYAKRQKTWFKRNPGIHWISKPEESVDLITTMLNK